MYISTTDDGLFQGTLPVELRVQFAAPHVSSLLTAVTELGDDEQPTASPEVAYTYDYLNRLVQRSAGTGSETFLYDGGQVLARFNAQGQITNRYLWGPTVDMLLADEQEGGELLWALGDHQNSVRDLVRVNPTTQFSLTNVLTK